MTATEDNSMNYENENKKTIWSYETWKIYFFMKRWDKSRWSLEQFKWKHGVDDDDDDVCGLDGSIADF